MAVTQQLARVSGEYLERCRATAVARPDADPDWYPPVDDLLDLDWAPSPLIDVFGLAGVAPSTRAALVRALDGDPEVDVSYLRHPEATGCFGPPPTALAPESVAGVAAELTALDGVEVLAAIPADRYAALVGDGFTGDPSAYLTTHFTALRDFYENAARRGLFVVLWWD
ncbi:DUF1877 domain-containing protein [Streptomyces mobaraensis NBRC 13819 = DSM 40847]|uniref:DUF1877 domain-containing protein n=1 Tax=Streptomyces mobaraensis (strain ATCC 29032 / DSM 40847 / JCM 4168 / NBRC 13819 / NCIMB 11159 / IPCR 16-22) TaxID=1223523 RepID=M3AT03_STRM1|nr:hypothetical protein [Streptomyces mobaraensis]EME96727.1 hypothetical protein H340_30096 [Streptomyces mobaraensis NBRC 13819 = DSM 40847]QTT72953.1 DUF1877 domain-containing protein [Streptomyces mobaraensis NBRC 13819 = DSM 40847]